jgi:hypothetical protein
MTLYKIKVHDTLYLCDDTTLADVRAIAIKALKQGREVKWFDGKTQWLSWDVVLDLDKHASDIYTWDKSYNRVLHNVVLHTKPKDGDTTHRLIGEVYRKF